MSRHTFSAACALDAFTPTPTPTHLSPSPAYPGEDFKHFDLKWNDYESLSWRPCAEPGLAERLKVRGGGRREERRGERAGE